MVFFVAEIGSNWEGDVKKAKSLIAHCKLANISAVKFQMWRQKDLYHDERNLNLHSIKPSRYGNIVMIFTFRFFVPPSIQKPWNF